GGPARPRSLRSSVTDLLTYLGRFAVPRLDLLDQVAWNPTRGAVFLESFDHLAFGSEECLEELADLFRARLLLASCLKGLAMLLSLVSSRQQLLACSRRSLRRAKRRSRAGRPHPGP